MAEQVVKSVTEELNCSICMNRFRVPKMLDCIHSFCEICLEDYVKKLNGKELTCPMCRKVCAIPAGVKGLQTNIYLVNLCEKIDLYEKLKTSKVASTRCESCKKNTTVSAFCVDCKYAICKNCEKQHSLFPAVQSHSIEQIGNLEFDQMKLQKIKTSIMVPSCDLHAPEKLRFYCQTCSKLICRECTVVQHPKPEHICVEAPSQFEDVKMILSNFLRESSAELKFVSKYKADAKSGEIEIKMKSNALMKEIKDRYDILISGIESQLNKQLEEARQIVQKNQVDKESNIDESVKLADNWIKRMESTRETTQKVVQENNMWELLGLSNNLVGSFQTLRNDKSEFQWDISELTFAMTFTPSKIPNIPLGKCFSTNGLIVCEYQGNFMKFSFDYDKSQIEITKMQNPGGDSKPYTAKNISTVSWQFKTQDEHFRFTASANNTYFVLGIHKWLVVEYFNPNEQFIVFKLHDSITSLAVSQNGIYIMFDDKPNTIYYSGNFATYCGSYGRQSKTLPLNLESLSQAYPDTLTPCELSYTIKDLRTSIGDALLVTTKHMETLVQYQIHKKAQHVINVKTPNSAVNSKKLAILNIVDGSQRYVTAKRHDGSPITQVSLPHVTLCILWGESTKTVGDSSNQLFITRYQTSNDQHTHTCEISADVGLPRACYFDQRNNVLRVCNAAGEVYTLS